MLEDEVLDVELNKAQLLLLNEYNCIVKWVVEKEAYINELLQNQPDLILSDYSLPRYNGLDALNDLKALNLFIPFIFVTGTINEETAAHTIKAGAWDYVVKDRLFRLPIAIRSVLQTKQHGLEILKAEEQNRKLLMALEQSPAHIIITDIKGQIEYVNSKYTEVTGFTFDEVRGKTHQLFNLEHSNEQYFALMWENILSGKIWSGELINWKKNGTSFWEHTSISPIKNENGEITHFVAVKEDISQRKQLESELIEAKERAERSDKLKEAFLQNLSHEIRTPLNAIVGFSGILNEDNSLTDEQKGFTTVIMESSAQLLSIVSDILTISRIQIGQEFLSIKPVRLNDMLDQLFTIFNPKANKRNIQFLIHKGNNNPNFEIKTDEPKVYQILTNLLNNAIKFTQKGSIDCGYSIKNNFIEFYIKDTGIGIKPENFEIIFERFGQAELTISRNYGGTGLGLAIAKSYVDILQGSISVESDIDKGSTFYFSIPYIQILKNIDVEINKQIIESNGNTTVLVAEDEEYNYMLIDAILSAKKCTVIHAENGREAVELCNNNNIDIVLMDIKMPEMDGLTAMMEIRKFKSSLPIIAQTAYALEHEKCQLLEKGFTDYIAKPLKKEVLWDLIVKYTKNEK